MADVQFAYFHGLDSVRTRKGSTVAAGDVTLAMRRHPEGGWAIGMAWYKARDWRPGRRGQPASFSRRQGRLDALEMLEEHSIRVPCSNPFLGLWWLVGTGKLPKVHDWHFSVGSLLGCLRRRGYRWAEHEVDAAFHAFYFQGPQVSQVADADAP